MTLVRFVEIKVKKNGHTWSLICFSKKKYMKYGLACVCVFFNVILH